MVYTLEIKKNSKNYHLSSFNPAQLYKIALRSRIFFHSFLETAARPIYIYLIAYNDRCIDSPHHPFSYHPVITSHTHGNIDRHSFSNNASFPAKTSGLPRLASHQLSSSSPASAACIIIIALLLSLYTCHIYRSLIIPSYHAISRCALSLCRVCIAHFHELFRAFFSVYVSVFFLFRFLYYIYIYTRRIDRQRALSKIRIHTHTQVDR